MNDRFLLQLLGGGLGSGFDLTALMAFVAFAVLYLLVPVIGYCPQRPAGLVAALYLLIGYGCLSLLQLLVQWSQIAGRSTPGTPTVGRSGEGTVHLLFVFAALQAAVFLLALGTFVAG